MSKYFIKIIALVLLVTAFHLSSGFCFEALFNGRKIKVASAATFAHNNSLIKDVSHSHQIKDVSHNHQAKDDPNSSLAKDDMAVCGQDQKTYPSPDIFDVKSAPQQASHPTAPPSKNILPCCLDGAHSSLATFSQSGENDKLAAVIIFIPAEIPSTIFKTFIYQPILIPPPELLALRSTVLRL